MPLALAPLLSQSAFFARTTAARIIKKLCIWLAPTISPGGGTPSVMMSAKMTARLIAADFGIAASPPVNLIWKPLPNPCYVARFMTALMIWNVRSSYANA